MDYQIIRSHRTTISLQLHPDGRLIVRAPYRLTDSEVRAFVMRKG